MNEPQTEAGHEHTPNCDCLPIRVVVDQHGHYWRDYGDHWSMCPVSDENTATWPVTEFYRFGGDFEAGDPHVLAVLDRLAAAVRDVRFQFAQFPGDGADGDGPMGDLLAAVLDRIAAEREAVR